MSCPKRIGSRLRAMKSVLVKQSFMMERLLEEKDG